MLTSQDKNTLQATYKEPMQPTFTSGATRNSAIPIGPWIRKIKGMKRNTS